MAGPKMTPLGMRLTVDESREAAIAQVVEAYTRTRSVSKTATELEVGFRTLQRWIADMPELRQAIEKVRG